MVFEKDSGIETGVKRHHASGLLSWTARYVGLALLGAQGYF